MVSKFLLNIFAKGSIYLQNGRLTLWNNPFLFIPMSSFAILQKGIIDLMGYEGENLLYWLGRLQGRNSSEVFIKRFGYKPSEENFKYFIDGSILVGMGDIHLVELNIPKIATLECVNSPLAITYLDKFGKSKNSMDHYMRGILSGGSEPLVKFKIDCNEVKCIAKGDKKCVYELKKVEIEKTPDAIKSLGDISTKIVTFTEGLFLKRRLSISKIFSKQLINFNDGSLFIDNVRGLIIPTYIFSIISKVLMQTNSEKFLKILDEVSKDYILSLRMNFNLQDKPTIIQINNLFKKLDKFGFGEFRAIKYIGSDLIIQNSTNPYPDDYKTIFGIQNTPVDFLSTSLIKAIFNYCYPQKKINVLEKNCLSCKKTPCLFCVSGL